MRDAGRVLESLLVERRLQMLRRAPSEHWTVSFWDSPVGGLWGLRREPVESQIFRRWEPRLHPGVKLSRMQFKFLVWSSWSPWWSVEWENPDFLRMVFFFPSVTLLLFPVPICSSGIKPVLIIWLIILYIHETVCWRRWRTRFFSPWVPSDSFTSQLCDFSLVT